jgi:hypothetical protein
MFQPLKLSREQPEEHKDTEKEAQLIHSDDALDQSAEKQFVQTDQKKEIKDGNQVCKLLTANKPLLIIVVYEIPFSI